MGLRAGQLQEWLAFDKRPIVADDLLGNVEGEWTEQFQCAGRVKPLVGGEQVLAQRLQGVQPVVITVRRWTRSEVVTTDWRVRDTRSGEVYAIRAVTKAESRDFIDFLAASGVAHG